MRELTVRAMLHNASLGSPGDAEAATMLATGIDNPQLGPLVAADPQAGDQTRRVDPRQVGFEPPATS